MKCMKIIWPNYSKEIKKNLFFQISTELCKKIQKIQKVRKLVKNAIMHAKTRSHFSKVSTYRIV